MAGGSNQDDALANSNGSTSFPTRGDAVAAALNVLRPLRKLFAFVAVTDCPRVEEQQTRAWLEERFPHVFEQLVFVASESGTNEDTGGELSRAKVYKALDVKIAIIGSDADVSARAAQDLGSEQVVILVGAQPAGAKDTNVGYTLVKAAADWREVKSILKKVVIDWELKPAKRVPRAPTIATSLDGLITISTREPAG